MADDGTSGEAAGQIKWRVWADLGFEKGDVRRAYWRAVTQPFDTRREAEEFAGRLNLSTKVEEEDWED